MLQLAITFLVIALIAAFFGFAGVASLSWEGAKIIFVVFLTIQYEHQWHALRSIKNVAGVQRVVDQLRVIAGAQRWKTT